MQAFWILHLAVQIMYYCPAFAVTNTYHEQRKYGEQLSIRLSAGAEKLQFSSVDETEQHVLWSRFTTTKRGTVTGRNDDRRFVIHSVTFDDEGIYTVLNFWNKKSAIYLLKVITKTSSQDCLAGETFSIYLGDLRKSDATLHFSNQDFNLTLVERGSPVGNLHPDYMGRIQVTSNSIDVHKVNVSDVGNYTISDRLNRKVKIISMNLVDHHPGIKGGSLAALLLLLGIPPCICCCCRKKICKKSSQPNTTSTTTSTTTVKYDNQMNPHGPPPAYPGTTPGYTSGYPAVAQSTVHPPPNPIFPPQPLYSGYPALSPAMPPNPNPLCPPVSAFPPAQPPQWSGAPSNQPAPAGFAPVIYNVTAGPEPVKGDIPPTTPLLTPPQPEVPQHPAPDSTLQFNIKGNDSSSNFL